jgi:hypothetical protein
MKNALKSFEKEIESYAREFGDDAASRALRVLCKVLFWGRNFGHGNLVLSAVNHIFGLKIRADTVFSVKDN